MSVLSGDYIGFSYDGVHSSELGIMRVSDGSRFNENLLPVSQDKIVQVPGGDGAYYFGSQYTQRQINISFAFDEVTEAQLNYMKELFGKKKPCPLIFDEAPYKVYSAKVTGSNTIRYIPFGEGATNRIYKGEGNIQFTCYQPYAICKDKDIRNYSEEQSIEWNNAANLIELSDSYKKGQVNGNQRNISIYNPGVKESDWELIIFFKEDGTIPKTSLYISEEQSQGLSINKIPSKKGNDIGIKISSKTNLIEGINQIKFDLDKPTEYIVSGNLYNEYISSGSFFKIPVTVKKSISGITKRSIDFIINFTGYNDTNSEDSLFKALNYDYYYF